jgi:hypothetical protein
MLRIPDLGTYGENLQGSSSALYCGLERPL